MRHRPAWSENCAKVALNAHKMFRTGNRGGSGNSAGTGNSGGRSDKNGSTGISAGTGSSGGRTGTAATSDLAANFGTIVISGSGTVLIIDYCSTKFQKMWPMNWSIKRSTNDDRYGRLTLKCFLPASN